MVLEETNKSDENVTVDDVQDAEHAAGPAGKKPLGLPEGKFRFVGWGVDTTGRRLIDEICQIAAYTPSSQFSQYIMPFADLNPSYRKRHNIRVVTLGRYRMLKDMRSNKFIKTKSEVSALTDFLAWLEKVRGDGVDGIVLLYHESRKTSPGLLLEALRRYNLIEKFNELVKGFANCYNLAEAKCAKTTKAFSLRMLSKVLLDKEIDLGSAINRAKSCFDIVVHLGQGERQDLETSGSGDCSLDNEQQLTDLLRPYGNSVSAEEAEIAGFKVILERQNTFRPVFGMFLKANRNERLHASRLRRLLAENDIDFNKLKAAWDKGEKQELEEVLQKEVANANEKDIADLLEILDCFFDPNKKPVEPKPREPREPRKPRNDSTASAKDKEDKENVGKIATNNNNVSEKTVAPVKDVNGESITDANKTENTTTTISESNRTENSATEQAVH